MTGFLSTGLGRAADCGRVAAGRAAGCGRVGAGRALEGDLAAARGVDRGGLAEMAERGPTFVAGRGAIAILLVLTPRSSNLKKPMSCCSSCA